MLITGRQLAMRLGIAYQTYCKWKKERPDNLPPAVIFAQSYCRYDEKTVEEWIRRHTRQYDTIKSRKTSGRPS